MFSRRQDGGRRGRGPEREGGGHMCSVELPEHFQRVHSPWVYILELFLRLPLEWVLHGPKLHAQHEQWHKAPINRMFDS